MIFDKTTIASEIKESKKYFFLRIKYIVLQTPEYFLYKSSRNVFFKKQYLFL